MGTLASTFDVGPFAFSTASRFLFRGQTEARPYTSHHCLSPPGILNPAHAR